MLPGRNVGLNTDKLPALERTRTNQQAVRQGGGAMRGAATREDTKTSGPLALNAYTDISSTGWLKKLGHRLMTILLSNLNRFKNVFIGRFLGKFAVK